VVAARRGGIFGRGVSELFVRLRHHLVEVPARTYGEVAMVAVLSALLAIPLTMAAFRWLAGLPADHFSRPPPPRAPTSPATVLRLVGRNLAGATLVLLGVVLSVPGVPGPGLITLLVGLLLLDFPGKRRIELAVLRRPRLRAAVDRARARRGRPPLELP